ncbi:chromosome loss- protein [Exophiala dermatitidis]|uniref:Chromosome loss- protein n=1 Tax=Exophiala dermatitidis TaxID=5970 RepID=A0AAN6F5C5_EXODE|nr:chromosome loss- protein [Exophiala dermatitidis]KAJ4527785.1 chromosome loss- protein [Exophiala dermatitidis]KAJ4528421.1 chromosome loss- protein [Exophiala dermatitidis]KAJ4531378.1 chromosome loss- protein [Exophiala dermatitidis]KAJ4552788.1 chromosome loss- protein [Exophiala dermatitidis]
MAPALAKSLGRLSREAIIDLVLSWLKEPGSSTPYLLNNRKLFEADEEDYLHTPAETIKELEKLYRQFLTDKSNYRKQDIIDRIVDGDWRRGLSLHQHASIDFAHLEQNDNALRWTALKLVPLTKLQDESHEEEHTYSSRKRRKLNHDCCDTKYPQISPRTFVSSLRAEISPLVKAHFHIHRMPALYGLTIIRLYITLDAAFRPRSSKIPRRVKHATDAGRVMYIALPDSCPFVYVSLSGSIKRDGRAKSARDSGEAVMSRVNMATMKKIILEAIPKAVSRPQERWALQSASLTARSLRSICRLRCNLKPGTGGGVYSAFASNVHASHDSPVGVQLPAGADDKELHHSIDKRFGHMVADHYAPLDRVHVKVEKLLKQAAETDTGPPGSDQGDIALTFSGSDVFLGLRKLAGMGTSFVDLDGMPAWMTGEVGVSSLSI